MYLLLISLLILFLSAVNGEYRLIGSTLGVIKGEQTGPTTYVVKAVPFNYTAQYDDTYYWELRRDDNFPNGEFIHWKANPNLVWDTKANSFTAGTPIILYQKKTTLETTKNQRWHRYSTGKYALILNMDTGPNVTQLGNLVLGRNKMMSGSIVPVEHVNVTLNNTRTGNTLISAETPFGDLNLGTMSQRTVKSFSLWVGTTMFFKTATNARVNPWAYVLRKNFHPTVALPGPAPPPMGLRTWRGTVSSFVHNSNMDPSHINITFQKDGSGGYTFSGVGSDRYGICTVYGEISNSGSENSLSMKQEYPETSHYVSRRDGYYTASGTNLNGMWTIGSYDDFGGIKYNLEE